MQKKNGGSFEQPVRYWEAVFLLAGTILGVGLFTVPYVLSLSGVTVGLLYFVLLGAIVLCAHLAYGEIVRVEGTSHRFVGYMEQILGARYRKPAAFLAFASNYGSLLAYTVLGGSFLYTMFAPLFGGNVWWYQLFFLLAGSGLVFLGRRVVNGANFVMTVALVLALLGLSGGALTGMRVEHLLTFDAAHVFTPFGVILFSLLGTTAIPEMGQYLGKRGMPDLRHAIVGGTLIALVCTLFFGVAIVGLTGSLTTPDAISGAAGVLGSWVAYLGALTGFLATITSFIVVALALFQTFRGDYGHKSVAAWGLMAGPVFLLFFLGLRDLLTIIGGTGGIFLGLMCLSICLAYLELLRRPVGVAKFMRMPRWLFVGCTAVFGVGVLIELLNLFLLK